MPESDPRRRILELIAAAPGKGGITEQRLLEQGANARRLVNLVNEGLVTATSERLVSHWPRGVGVVLTLTAAGRSVLNAS